MPSRSMCRLACHRGLRQVHALTRDSESLRVFPVPWREVWFFLPLGGGSWATEGICPWPWVAHVQAKQRTPPSAGCPRCGPGTLGEAAHPEEAASSSGGGMSGLTDTHRRRAAAALQERCTACVRAFRGLALLCYSSLPPLSSS